MQRWTAGAAATAYEREAQRAAAAVAAARAVRRPRAHRAARVQRLGISDALDYFADKANLIPGFRMFTSSSASTRST